MSARFCADRFEIENAGSTPKERRTMTTVISLNGNGTHAAIEETLQAVADRINQRMGEAVEAIISVGVELLAAKERLPHGQFGRIFPNHPDAVTNPLRISRRTAEVYMSIARHPVLANAQNSALLPASWNTLGVLARLPAPILEVAIADGRVNADLKGRDAERLAADGGDDHELAELRGLVDSQTMFWGPDRLLRAAVALREKADDLDRRAQQQRDGDGARQAAALLARTQTIASMDYNERLVWARRGLPHPVNR